MLLSSRFQAFASPLTVLFVPLSTLLLTFSAKEGKAERESREKEQSAIKAFFSIPFFHFDSALYAHFSFPLIVFVFIFFPLILLVRILFIYIVFIRIIFVCIFICTHCVYAYCIYTYCIYADCIRAYFIHTCLIYTILYWGLLPILLYSAVASPLTPAR